jgi:hypothetical protein
LLSTKPTCWRNHLVWRVSTFWSAPYFNTTGFPCPVSVWLTDCSTFA